MATFLVSVFFGCDQKNAKNSLELEKLTLGVESSLLPTAVWVAEDKGLFKKEGLDLTIKEFGSGRLSFLAMLKGDQGINISTVAPTPIMFESFDRKDFSIFATFAYSYSDVKVIARRDQGIQAAIDLKGKTIGTPAGTTGQFFTEAFLIYNGIPSSDVEVIDTASKDLPDAFKAKRLLGDRAVSLESSGVYKETFNFMVMNDYAKSHSEALRRFLKAIEKATEFTKSNKKEAQAIVVKRLNLEEATTAAIWDDFIFEVSLDQSLVMTLEDEARWAINSKLTDIEEVPNYIDYIDMSALQEVNPEAVSLFTNTDP
jgi:NitT/TauT family transport system substrate-binding protein